MTWAHSLAPDMPVRVVIEDGQHALETQYLSEHPPSRVLDAFSKTFEKRDLEHAVVHPTDEYPVGRFLGSIGGEQKRILILPADGERTTLVRVTSFKSSRRFAKRYPSWVELHPEVDRLGGRMVSERESYGEGGHSGIFTFESRKSVTSTIRKASSRLARRGWVERATAGRDLRSAGSSTAVFTKNGNEVSLRATRKGRMTDLVVVLSAPR